MFSIESKTQDALSKYLMNEKINSENLESSKRKITDHIEKNHNEINSN